MRGRSAFLCCATEIRSPSMCCHCIAGTSARQPLDAHSGQPRSICSSSLSPFAASSQWPRQRFVLRVALRHPHRHVALAGVRQSEFARNRRPRAPPARLEPVRLPARVRARPTPANNIPDSLVRFRRPRAGRCARAPAAAVPKVRPHEGRRGRYRGRPRACHLQGAGGSAWRAHPGRKRRPRPRRPLHLHRPGGGGSRASAHQEPAAAGRPPSLGRKTGPSSWWWTTTLRRSASPATRSPKRAIPRW